MENNRGKLKKEELNLVEENSTELNSVEESKKTILVVDDEKPIVDILTYNLQKEGYSTLEANDGEEEQKGLYIYNLGTGIGYSVLDVVKAFEKATGKTVKYRITERRLGDIATCYANPTKAKQELGWQAEKNLEDMCRDSWNYIQKNN